MPSEVSTVGGDQSVEVLRRELAEAREQQAATSEILHAISNSPTDAQVVLDAIAESAARLLDVPDADIMRLEGEMLRLVAKHGPSQQWAAGSERRINRNWVTGRSVVDRTTVHVADLQLRRSPALLLTHILRVAEFTHARQHRSDLDHSCRQPATRPDAERYSDPPGSRGGHRYGRTCPPR